MKAESQKPMDKTISMLEYLVKTDGAEHLKIGSRKLNIFYFYSMDVLIFYCFILILSFYYLIKPVKCLVNSSLFKNNGNV